MVKEIRIYIEGGGEGKDQKRFMKIGFSEFLKSVRELARKNTNVERIEKSTLEDSLNRATEKTRKGKYHKIQHAYQILQSLNVTKVRQASPYCDRLFKTLEELLNYY